MFWKKNGPLQKRPALLEQPVPRADLDGLKKISCSTDIPVCADESVSSLPDAVRAVKEKAVQAINIKFMKTGLFHSREIALLAQAAGVDLMIGAMMETSLSIMAAANLAAGVGGFKYIDLDTPYFIKEGDRNPHANRAGVYNLEKVKTGVGIKRGRIDG